MLLGDSITWQNFYASMLQSYFAKRLPRYQLRFVNRGVRGDTAESALRRIDRDVLAHDPQMVLIFLGMNDGGYKGFSRLLLGQYTRNMRRLVRSLKERTKAQLVLVTSTCVSPTSKVNREYNRMLGAMARQVRSLGQQLNLPVIDLFSHYHAQLDRSRSMQKPVRLMQDPVHPGPAGHLLIAEYLLRNMAPPPKPLRTVKIHLSRAPTAQHPLKVRVAHAHDNIYVVPPARDAWRLVPLSRRFNRQLLVVTGIPLPVRIRIEETIETKSYAKPGHDLGVFSPSVLAKGVDLNHLEHAPWVREAAMQHALLQQRWFWTYYLWNPKQLQIPQLLKTVPPDWNLLHITHAEAREKIAAVDRQLEKIKPRRVEYDLIFGAI